MGKDAWCYKRARRRSLLVSPACPPQVTRRATPYSWSTTVPARMLLLGDAVYCPQQLSHSDWQAASDVDPALARRTRETFLRDLELHGGEAVGSHFPGLIAGRGLPSSDVAT